MSQNETELKFRNLISTCDSLIKAGKASFISALLGQLNLAQIPRNLRQDLAKICRRSGLIGYGLRILHPIIRNEKFHELPATSGEVCEYAVLLSRNGSIKEALQLLQQVDPLNAPEALLYKGYCHISKWEYGNAIGFLSQFIRCSNDDYSKLIAQVNLCSAFVATGQFTQAQSLLEATIELARSANSSRLVGNCHEMLGQVSLHQGNYNLSRAQLAKASEIFGSGHSSDQLFISKWQAINTALETKATEPLLQFRKAAVHRKHWESVREADLFLLKIQFDQKLFDHLVIGTPMTAYRERIQQLISGMPSDYFVLGPPSATRLDLRSGESGGSASLNPGKKIHQMLSLLTKDFYVPTNIGNIFAELYPDEYFNISTSSIRVHQMLRRTRRWLDENQISASIDQHQGAYKLTVHGALEILVPLERQQTDSFSVLWTRLKNLMADQTSFTADAACSKLDCSRSSFHRLVKWAIENKFLIKTGSGRSTLHEILPTNPSLHKNVA